MLYYVGNGPYLRLVAQSIFIGANRLSSLKKLYVAYQTSIQKMILNLFSIPSYLPCYNSKILEAYYAAWSEQFTAASFMRENRLYKAEW